MNKFIVNVREVYVQGYKVTADDEETAKAIVRAGGGVIDEDRFEYSHTLDSETWTVEELDEWPKHRDPVDNG
jgi:hypothetical protein